MSFWGGPRGLLHNLQIQLTRFNLQEFYEQGSTNKNDLQASELLQPYFKSRKGISRTSLHCGVLNKIHRQIFLTTICSTGENKKNYYQQATYEDNFSTFPQQRILFWFTSSGFLKRPVSLKYWLLRPFFYKEATCKSSTVKGLLYAAKAVPSKDYFTHLTLKNARRECWVISPNYCASHPWRFCAVGDVLFRLGGHKHLVFSMYIHKIILWFT